MVAMINGKCKIIIHNFTHLHFKNEVNNCVLFENSDQPINH